MIKYNIFHDVADANSIGRLKRKKAKKHRKASNRLSLELGKMSVLFNIHR